MKIPDVCLLLEGTFPYVRGGVSGWVHRLIELHPHLTFALFFLGANRKSATKQYYDIPENVVEFQEAFLFERPSAEEIEPAKLSKQTTLELAAGLEAVYFAPDEAARIQAVLDFATWLGTRGKEVHFGNLLNDRACWEVLKKVYERWFPTVSFIDFFWTCRIIHAPLWQMLRALPLTPKAAVYHSISTGYAGGLGAMIARQRNAPFFLTEHGIYTKERMIEITQADWIHESPGHGLLSGAARLALKHIWTDMFTFLGKLTYEVADPIISLYSGNAVLQKDFGAQEERIEIIPNGILAERFQETRRLRALHKEANPLRCCGGFVGRIVPIKDVKTLLRAARMVGDVLPDATFSLYGPTNEDKEYYAECLEMVETLDLGKMVAFHGSGRVEEIFEHVDILLLTSISEALPLVILEAFACGIPAIVTDVGACRELLNGRTPEDKAVGRGGILTGISSPAEIAEAFIRLARDVDMRHKMGAAGLARVKHFYDEKQIMARYDELYKSYIQKGSA